ncbi:uncharacterized protein LOC116248346 isoform X2 [Nymphaea colorata]|uniref:uncharacterized protein LOC116248346 isoform X2 n=1 Tax=Nymphaea colorata TaxID=210225 RepID=UPI00129E9B75|nr:uncharacterized protein LOC116248346 isoform X2 [Nymphaea colorata]
MDLSGFGRHFSPSTCLFLSPFIFCFLWIARPPNFCPFKSFLLLSSTFVPSHCPVMLSFRLLVLLLLLLLLSAGGDGDGGDGGCATSRVIVAATTWCVARSSMDNTSLQAALDYACGVGGADCSPISSDGLCFLPNTLQAHASYAMNSYYQRSGHGPTSCDFSGAGVIAMTDPSYGSCVYPSSASQWNRLDSTTNNYTHTHHYAGDYAGDHAGDHTLGHAVDHTLDHAGDHAFDHAHHYTHTHNEYAHNSNLQPCQPHTHHQHRWRT